MKKNTLKELFASFVEYLNDAESIDNLNLSSIQRKQSRISDYFFCHRKIVCEQKSLDTDMTLKFQKELSIILSNENNLKFYGWVDVEEIIRKFPESDKIRKKLFNRITKAIEGAFEEAHKQIKATKDVFSLPSSYGVMLILNESSYLLSPDIVTRKISEMFAKKNKDGTIRYQEIKAAWLLQLSHNITLDKRTIGCPSVILLNNISSTTSELSSILNNLENLERQFAQFMGLYHFSSNNNLEDHDMRPTIMPRINLH